MRWSVLGIIQPNPNPARSAVPHRVALAAVAAGVLILALIKGAAAPVPVPARPQGMTSGGVESVCFGRCALNFEVALGFFKLREADGTVHLNHGIRIWISPAELRIHMEGQPEV